MPRASLRRLERAFAAAEDVARVRLVGGAEEGTLLCDILSTREEEMLP